MSTAAPLTECRPQTTLEQLWADHGFVPNPQQKAAIRAASGPLYITAGPGSGKTSVLVWRTLNLIVFHNVPPEQIMLGTFTEKGAHQLRERLRVVLALASEKTERPYDISRMSIGTIHSICRKLLLDRRLSPRGTRPRAPTLLDEFAQYQFVYRARNWSSLLETSGLTNRAITQFFENRSSSSRHRAVVNAIGFFNRLSEESIDPARTRPRDPTVRALLKMYVAYRNLLQGDPDRLRTDLSLLQWHAYRRITESDAGSSIFQHVIVDEYQDTNAIQEQIYFRLAEQFKNLCVVGDDDQALYRFRGATVDNFLAFPERCESRLRKRARRIGLETNYRSRANIVSFYNAFMEEFDWSHRGRSFRVDKTIQPHRTGRAPAVFHAEPAGPDDVAHTVANVVRRLIDRKRVQDASEIAFLFPSLASRCVSVMKEALEEVGLSVYAPRAGRFLDQDEAVNVLGTMLLIFGNPGHQHSEYAGWLAGAADRAEALLARDKQLERFVKERREEIQRVVHDDTCLRTAVEAAGLSGDDPYDEQAARALQAARGISNGVRRFLESGRLVHYIREQRKRRPDRAITLRYVINRACSLDWGTLDLFYQLTAFKAFREAFDLAESGTDEGPICNLSLLSDYLARFQEQTSPVISGQFLRDGIYARVLFSSYFYSVYRLGASEYEDKEDPFPKGRIPFLTIHQAKGLEFPIVVLGNLRKDARPRKIDSVVSSLGARKLEPADLAPTFDVARMFYVALSRARNLLILCPYAGAGQRYRAEFRSPLAASSHTLDTLEVDDVPAASQTEPSTPHPYSFTGDYIQYAICPRRYMLYRRYNFAPSRGQTMIFGNLVHRTIEDLHQHLIQLRVGDSAIHP